MYMLYMYIYIYCIHMYTHIIHDYLPISISLSLYIYIYVYFIISSLFGFGSILSWFLGIYLVACFVHQREDLGRDSARDVQEQAGGSRARIIAYTSVSPNYFSSTRW